MRPSITSPNLNRLQFPFGRENAYLCLAFDLKRQEYYTAVTSYRHQTLGKVRRGSVFFGSETNHGFARTVPTGQDQEEAEGQSSRKSVSPPKGSPRTLEVGTLQCRRSRRGTRRLNRMSACIATEPFPAGEKTTDVRTEIQLIKSNEFSSAFNVTLDFPLKLKAI